MKHPKLLKLKNLLRRKEKPADLLKRIYKDKNGNIYYRFDDPRKLPAPRLRVAELAAGAVERGLSAEDGVNMTRKVLDHFDQWVKNQKSTGFADGLAIIVELNHLFTLLANEDTLQKLATVYFVMNNEDPHHYIQSQQQAKIDAWDIDREAKDFFLCRAAEITNFYGTTSDKDILMYLKTNQPELKKAARFLEKSGLSNT